MADDERTEHGRRLAESLRRAAEIAEGEDAHDVRSGPRMLPHENWGFAEGVKAERHLRENVCPNGANPYGPYIEPPRSENTVAIGGRGAYALFQAFMIDWFGRQSPDTLAALDALARQRMRREIFRQIIRENWLRASAAAAFVFAAVQHGATAWAWVNDHMPAIKAIWQAISTKAAT